MKLSDIKYDLKTNMLLPKAKKLNVSKELLEYLINRDDSKDANEIIMLIKKSKNQDDFENNIIEYIKNNEKNIYYTHLLIGTFLGKYNYFRFFQYDKPNLDNIQNFTINDNKEIIDILRNHLIEYISENNDIKNLFAPKINGLRDLSKDVDYEKVKELFEDIVNGKEIANDEREKAKSIFSYIFTILNNYPMDDIKNNFDFIKYDLKTNNNKTLDEKRDDYLKNQNLKEETKIKLSNIDILKDRLNRINNEKSKELLKRFERISDNPEEIDDINLEYEMLFRSDIISHLYVPTEEVTIVDDFRDVKPQLIHCFKRDTKKFRNILEQRIKEKIISERNNKNDDPNLTKEEQIRFDNLLNKLDAELDQTMVNYSFDGEIGKYTDSDGFNSYKSDTSNQIAASVYSENFFNLAPREMIGIGFNSEGMVPESIAISSPFYLTTNKGLNNIEYNQKIENNVTSACYDELINNDGKSEVVLFRNNMDYDTKASYIFVAYDSQYDKNYQNLIDKGRKLAEKNPGMKLVLYDLAKIRDSYKKYNEEIMTESKTEEKGKSK